MLALKNFNLNYQLWSLNQKNQKLEQENMITTKNLKKSMIKKKEANFLKNNFINGVLDYY